MRFFKDGPSIPDELLNARDEGRVVFFCGAGVSRARAGLLDFFGLANEVIALLRVHKDSPVHKVLHEAWEIGARTGVGGLISADRLFGLLEREFAVNEIWTAVAKALRPKKDVDVSAHRILLDLAKTPDGGIRLVTTNFDRLFDLCDPALKIWHSSRLPDLDRAEKWHGVIHLHGRATEGYDGAEEDGFVLSSSEFGRAYLSDGWATNFFREILDRYVVVFVGYTADDPPVQYLLEGLNKKGSKLNGVYAFQAGLGSTATSRWLHKGVEAIPYAADNDHQALWDSLKSWVDRAKSPEDWQRAVIAMAGSGPQNLEAHERGQVAHLVSTVQGAASFSSAEITPPADWLCVLDPYRRFGNPGRIRIDSEQEQTANPFDLYSLDSDPIPSKGESQDDERTNAVIKEQSWNAFALNQRDRRDIHDRNIPSIQGHWTVNQAKLPARLGHLGYWIAKVAHQPACVWWAAHQVGLHSDVVSRIEYELQHSELVFLPQICLAWRHLFNDWKQGSSVHDIDWYNLKLLVEKRGWTSVDVREYAAVSRPYMRVQPHFWRRSTPPRSATELAIRDLVDLDVEYRKHVESIVVPDEWLEGVVRELRRNLELAIDLERELGGYGLNQISSLLVAEDLEAETSRLDGLEAFVSHFCKLFDRLTVKSSAAAKREIAAWQSDDGTVFARLRIWVSAKPELTAPEEFGPIVVGLNEQAFWDSYHQPDLLMAVAKRWNDLPVTAKSQIGNRLLRGPLDSGGLEEVRFAERAAWASLNRLHWLAANGCVFSFDLEHESKALQARSPEWQLAYAKKAVESMSMQGGMVRTETEHSTLLNESLSAVLATAQAMSGHGTDFLVNNDPFAGLCADRPVRAFNALTHAAKRDEFPEWAWRKFLNSDARKNDKPKLVALIAHRLCSYSHENIVNFIRPVSDWFHWKSELIAAQFPDVYDEFISKLLDVLQQVPEASGSSIVRGNKKPDWATEALNAPVGKIAQALMVDPRRQNQPALTGLNQQWLARVDKVLALGGDARRHGLVIFAYNLGWFYAREPKWTEAKMLSLLEPGNEQDRDAVWSGFFWAARTPTEDLFLRLKPHLLVFAVKGSWSKRGYGAVLVGVILNGWGSTRKGSNERFISDGELHEVLLNSGEEFRSKVLWLIGRWSHGQDKVLENPWFNRLLHLLRDVWPRQLSVKTPGISAGLCNLAFGNINKYSEVAAVVLPLLTRIDLDHLELHGLYQSGEEAAKVHPHLTLELLFAVLPENVTAWPYGIEKVLAQIPLSDVTLRADERLIELIRKWNARS